MNPPITASAKFRLGKIFVTAGARALIPQGDIQSAVTRHQAGDWGEASAETQLANDNALTNGNRLLSVYRSGRGKTFWLLTERDRSVTTVLLPHEC